MDKPGTYKKRPVIILAIKWTEDNLEAVYEFLGDNSVAYYGMIAISTLEGTMTANQGDWIIRGIKGEFYPCKPDIFEATYDEHTPCPCCNDDGYESTYDGQTVGPCRECDKQ